MSVACFGVTIMSEVSITVCAIDASTGLTNPRFVTVVCTVNGTGESTTMKGGGGVTKLTSTTAKSASWLTLTMWLSVTEFPATSTTTVSIWYTPSGPDIVNSTRLAVTIVKTGGV